MVSSSTAASGRFGVRIVALLRAADYTNGGGLDIEQGMAALGHHHRVDDDMRGAMMGEAVGHGLGNSRIRDHPDLHRIDGDVLEDRVDLVGDESG